MQKLEKKEFGLCHKLPIIPISLQPTGVDLKCFKLWLLPELKTLEWWISGLMLNPLFFLISRLNIACSPLIFNLQTNYPIRIKDIPFKSFQLWSNNLSLKDIGIRKFEFVAKAQLLLEWNVKGKSLHLIWLKGAIEEFVKGGVS